jgi:hypothetical protein
MRTFLLLALGALAFAQPRPQATLADFAWLEGKWEAQAGEGRRAEETYSNPAGGVIVSMFRMTQGERTLVLELTTITPGKDGLELRIRHFDTALTPWEKQDPIVMRLTKWDGKQAVFENFVHTRPKFNTITRTSPDTMDVQVVIVNPQTGERKLNFAFKRVK